jgi:hypothetical protein
MIDPLAAIPNNKRMKGGAQNERFPRRTFIGQNSAAHSSFF